MTLHYLSAHRQTPAEPLHQLGHHLHRLHHHQTLVSARVLLLSNVEVVYFTFSLPVLLLGPVPGLSHSRNLEEELHLR